MSSSNIPVLIVGGSGVVGSQAAKILRRFHPDLAITIGGRDLAKAEAVAKEIGASAARIDLGRADLGLPSDARFSAIAMFVTDLSLRALKYAQAQGAAYLDLSTGAFEIAPVVAHHVQKPKSSLILLASSWLAGAATLAVLHFARELETVDTIELGAIFDEQDMGGPAAAADYERLMKAAPSANILQDGKWRWVSGEEGTRRFRDVDGHEVTGQAYSVLDSVNLAAATNARSVRFDVAIGMSASRRRGEPYSTEIIIEMSGRQRDGTVVRTRHELVHPAGQAPVTAVSVVVALEHILGLVGEPAAPGLYLPSGLVEPAHLVKRLAELGTQIRRS